MSEDLKRDKLATDSIEDIKDRYNQAIYNLSDTNKELEEQLDYADTQLEKMYHEIDKRDKIIDELLILAKEV